jgi:hypothetical protein
VTAAAGNPEDSPRSTQSAKAEEDVTKDVTEDVTEEPLKGNTPQTCRKGARSGLQTQEEEEGEQ